MCVVSNVHDFYGDRFAPFLPIGPAPAPAAPIFITAPAPAEFKIVTKAEADELRQLIKDFRDAVVAAKTVDRLTAQPDCLDPEKGKLEARVAELERRLNAMAKAAGA